jgi:hypothetical protein
MQLGCNAWLLELRLDAAVTYKYTQPDWEKAPKVSWEKLDGKGRMGKTGMRGV